MNDVSRRKILKMAGSAAGASVGGRLLAMFDDGSIIRQGHTIPANKNLSSDWVKSLTVRGTKEVWKGDELDSVGMPVGGIATGQLYLRGDGTLGWWEIFNHHEFYGYGLTSYAKRAIPDTVKFQLGVIVNGKAFNLNKKDFPAVTFRGEHPIGITTYVRDDCPVKVTQSAYSPFIPLNSKDSALPATALEIEITNTSNKTTAVSVQGVLENAVSRSRPDAKRTTKLLANGFIHTADKAPDPFNKTAPSNRSQRLLADFENGYGEWIVSGDALGTEPAKGTLPNQNPVTGFVGKGLVNTYKGGDDTKGTLTSPTFKIDRKFLNFKIGGGAHANRTCINLIIDSKVVRTATGINNEALLWEAWDIAEFEGKEATLQIVDNMAGPWGHINVDHIFLADHIESKDDYLRRHGDPNRDHGTMALLVATGSAATSSKDGTGTLQSRNIAIAPGESKTITVVLAWHFPNHARGRQYANWFKDAEDVANYVVKNHKRLSNETRLWRDTFYDSTLPYWLLDRLHSTVANLATGTTEWWGNGRFWAWEGVVCCAGTCTHVWNYEHALARLFPDIQRNIRERQDFGEGFDANTGLVGFRSDRQYAADGQCGTILKAYREHLCSKDDKFLKSNWPKIKKALQFSMNHDPNGDGIIEDSQHNTYDINFEGANTFVGALYLAALRAGEEMAKLMKDSSFAAECRTRFERGQRATMQHLWSGEYFIQEVDQVKVKEHQYGPGCLSDQLFGQGWAHQVGLGHLYPTKQVRTALESIWKYNWTPDVGAHNKVWAPERPFAVPGEGGLFICTWPTGGRQKEPVRYRDEVWTGIEYQVAGHMIWEGMVEEGLAMCKAVHDRYHPAKRNPYNEVECSDHYARALASWGVLTALAGFEYDGPAGHIGFGPRMTPFKSVFTCAEGWGTFEQTASEVRLMVKYGRLRLSSISVSLPSVSSVRLGSKSVPFKMDARVIRFEAEQTLSAGATLVVR